MTDTEESEPQWFSRFREATDQRFSRLEAMVVDLLCRSRKEEKENPEEQIWNDEELAEIEAARKSSGIEDLAMENKANATVISAIVKKEQIPQIQVPSSKLEPGLQIHNASPTVCEDSQYVFGSDELCEHQKAIIQVSQVKARDELLMNSKNVTNNQDAHHLFDKMPLRVQSRRGHIKCHKTWMFKFKQRVATRESKSGFEVNMTHNQSKEYPCLFLASNAATLGHMLFESFPFLNFAAEQPLLWMQNNAERILIVSKLERKKEKLCYKTWMFKYKAPNLDTKVFETSGQCIRKRLFVSTNRGTQNNKSTLRVLMDTKQYHLSLRAIRVWDPGGSETD